MSNTSIFRNHLKEIDLYMEENHDEGEIFFRTTHNFDNGGSVVLVVAFDKTEEIIDLNVFNIANISNPLKKEAIHGLLNELNNNYRYAKFIEREGNISIQYSMSIANNNLNAADVLNSLISLTRTAQEEYPKFMRLQWA